MILAIVPQICLQLLQVGLEVKVFDVPTSFTIFNGSTESSYLLLILLQLSEPRTNNLTGIRISATKDAGLDKCVKMSP